MTLATKKVSDGTRTNTEVVWQGTDFEVKFTGGELYALQQLRDKVIPEYKSNLDDLAQTIVTQVNAVHSAGTGADGSTGVDFFDSSGTTAGSMAVNQAVAEDPNLIAASLSGEPGDVRNAQAISELRNQRVMSSGSLTINEYYSSFVGNLGIKSQESDNLTSNYNLVTTQLANAKESVQGVSIDEEMTNMMKYQRAYEAAARVITYVDTALETVISGMGVTR
jgi:flagellar hook-associated protein 1 FlgK